MNLNYVPIIENREVEEEFLPFILSKYKKHGQQLSSLPWYLSLLESSHQGTQTQTYRTGVQDPFDARKTQKAI